MGETILKGASHFFNKAGQTVTTCARNSFDAVRGGVKSYFDLWGGDYAFAAIGIVLGSFIAYEATFNTINHIFGTEIPTVARWELNR